MYYVQICMYSIHTFLCFLLFQRVRKELYKIWQEVFFLKSVLLTKQLYYFQKGSFIVFNPLTDPYLSPTDEALSRKNGQPVFGFHTSNAIE